VELQYFGANSLKIATKKGLIAVDPQSDIATLKTDLKKVNTVLATKADLLPKETGECFVIDGPGEYEFEDYSVKGLPAQLHTEASGDKSATMYRVANGDVSVLITGHIDSKLSEEQLEAIGLVDVLVIPVGGTGYTLDATEAATLTRAIEPKIVIPVHMEEDGLKYEVPQQALELFVKELGAPVAEEQPEKLKLKSLPEQLTVQVLKKQ
jgi:L-ascorbate metabolism protein UlaG (beta-lactamase superfamily)